MAQSSSRRAAALLWVALFAVLTAGPFIVEAQLGPLSQPEQAPQAKSQEEFDAYLKIVTQTNPAEVIQRVEAFAAQFSKSQLLGVAYEYQMHAYQSLGEFNRMLAAGQKALAANPENLNTLLTLAPAMANLAVGRPDQAQLLSQAEIYANNALEGIDKTRPPHQMPLAQWEQEKKTMQSGAHETLGVIALDRGDCSTAIHEFETAVLLQPDPEGAQFFRLGVAYMAAGRMDDAKKNLRHAAELGPDSVRVLALKQIMALSRKPEAPK